MQQGCLVVAARYNQLTLFLFKHTSMQSKQDTYNQVAKQIISLLENEHDEIAIMANTVALIHRTFKFFWTGFYRVVDNELVLGPFQGDVACMHINYGKGVCGTAWKDKQTIIVPDVELFPGHIACSSLSRSEIVVPLIIDGQVHSVLDIDSKEYNAFDETDRVELEKITTIVSEHLQSKERDIYFAAGCFWGAQHYLSLINGVIFTEVGFANGNADIQKPSYEMVYTDTTGYAETVHVRYDASKISLHYLTELYMKCINPTSVNKQGEDIGTRYRTGIYYTDSRDRLVIDNVLSKESLKYEEPLQVETEPLRVFYPAEEYHQNYLEKKPNGYCHIPEELFELARKANI